MDYRAWVVEHHDNDILVRAVTRLDNQTEVDEGVLARFETFSEACDFVEANCPPDREQLVKPDGSPADCAPFTGELLPGWTPINSTSPQTH